MANTKLSKIDLVDRWPGSASILDGVPVDGWDGTSHSCISGNPAYPPGTKIQAYQDNSVCPGYYTMMYGALAAVSSLNHNIENGSICTIAIGKGVCAHADITADASITADATYRYPYQSMDSSVPHFYLMHACQSAAHTDISEGGRVCFPCSTMSGGQWGWFWVGGVCPCQDATLLDSTPGEYSGHDMTSGGEVHPGAVMICISAAACLIYGLDFSTAMDDEGPRSPMNAYTTHIDH